MKSIVWSEKTKELQEQLSELIVKLVISEQQDRWAQGISNQDEDGELIELDYSQALSLDWIAAASFVGPDMDMQTVSIQPICSSRTTPYASYGLAMAAGDYFSGY